METPQKENHSVDGAACPSDDILEDTKMETPRNEDLPADYAASLPDTIPVDMEMENPRDPPAENPRDPPADNAASLSDTVPVIEDDEENLIKQIAEETLLCEKNNSRKFFSLRLLAIFLLQILAESIIIGNVFGSGSEFWRGPGKAARTDTDLVVTSSLLYLATLGAMVYCDLWVKEKRIYNYIVLVIYPLIIALAIVSAGLCDGYYFRPVLLLSV